MSVNRYFPPPIGARYGRLTVVADAGRHHNGYRMWRLKCDCGGVKECRASRVVDGETTSCGCYQRERARAPRPSTRTHGLTRTPEYLAWIYMKARCYNPNATGYAYYGGRGVEVHPGWRESFEAFLSDVGERPTSEHCLGRKDDDGHYEPGNVEWQTRQQQWESRRRRSGSMPPRKLDPKTEWIWRGKRRRL